MAPVRAVALSSGATDAAGEGVATMRTMLTTVAGLVATFIGAAVVVLASVEAYGVTLGGRHPGAPGYFGAALPPLWDALLDLGLGAVIACAGVWLRRLAQRRAAPDAGGSP